MLTMLFETGHPWITFKDPCNVRSPQDHVGVVHSSNLCTEITLNTSADETAVCNLGSVNLARHVVDGRLDEAALARDGRRLAIRMLDNVIDINFYPTPEARAVEPAAPAGRARHHGLPGRAVPARPAVRLAGGASRFADRDDGGGLVSRHPGVVAAGAPSAAPYASYRRLEVGSRPVPDRHARPARARARHADRRAARRGGSTGRRSTRSVARARHAQLEHDGDRADRDHRQHRRLLSRASSRSTRTSTSRPTSAASSRSSTHTWCAISRRSGCGAPTCSTS